MEVKNFVITIFTSDRDTLARIVKANDARASFLGKRLRIGARGPTEQLRDDIQEKRPYVGEQALQGRRG
ncbi:hypothetical protein EVAR_85515_1 [Eumeta japonica]|uniref:Uncharacterized protein n=1 Tax=Eumeta variegata TaxID=151549 RepID=A0A4C1VDB9_EUMVA|nr:hypothetical protein EVAR_85515_1 [Eumeta japonica]